MKTWLRIIILSSLLIVASLDAASFFTVKKIKIEGLQRVSRITLLSYLPIKKGQRFIISNANKVIKVLYATGFFTNIKLARDGQILIVKVQERPTISNITITGNKEIPTEKLNDALKKLGLQKGRFLDHATLQQVKQALRNQYYSTGRYNVSVNISQTNEARNRVAIAIQISEGVVAKVAGIKIIGNQHYKEKELLKPLHLQTPSLFTFFTHKDQYSAEKLQQSEQDIQNFYMNRGYINIKIDSAQVMITPDRKHVYLVFKINEGQQYHFSGYKLTGHLLDKKIALTDKTMVKKGDVFSRQVVLDSTKQMTMVLGNDGYAFANITPQPKINNKDKTVLINFVVQPGRQYYIRRIHFTGNSFTSELALRNQLYQMEGSLYSEQNIKDSVMQLRQNRYIDPIQPPQVTPVKVPGSNDLLDLNVNIAEKLSAEFQLSLGYSQVYGVLVNTGITQNNFMGTGKTAGFNIAWSGYQKSFSLNYFNPYYTPSGVSRSISISGTKTNANELNISSYSTDQYGVNVTYGFPLSIHSTLSLGYGFAYTHLITTTSSSQEMIDFTKDYGKSFYQLLLSMGWSRVTTDRPYFPTRGTQQSLMLTVSTPLYKKALQYYKLTYTHDWYHPLNQYFTLHLHGVIGYGNGYGFMSKLPFFENYYAGGLGVQGINRAYQGYSLGPRDSKNNAIGGNLLVSGMVSLILPDFFHEPSIRTSIFLDAGNVFTTYGSDKYGFKAKNIRYSYGAQLQWWTPLGVPLIFSLAAPINNKSYDQLEKFQFTIGTMF